ncbi:MAG TPA: 2-phosphosulfolactate phosphatase [Flavobacteriales bacterium]|nr:2-phosphosulfolactate phosphatase [Flavobacteriales bacterium]HPH83327.1 2-phosphosulfolactate phosphatase [Flavobacteriales bacterium]
MSLTVQTCFSPALYPLFANKEAIIIVVDVLRATSAICTALHHGVERMIPVAGLDEARKYKDLGYLVAAERNAVKQEGFDFGNSPFHYMDEQVKGKTIVISTTNGTQAIEAAKDASVIAIGSFLNLSALAEWILPQERDVIILCAGWKNKFNLEDSLFAGALANKLIDSGNFSTMCDSTIAAGYLYERASDDLYGFLEYSSHRKRLKNLHLEDDIRYCLSTDIMQTIPVYQDGGLVSAQKIVVL